MSWIDRSGSRARSGAAARTSSAAPACTTITLTEWATTSCSSRAIRARFPRDRGAGVLVPGQFQLVSQFGELADMLPPVAQAEPRQGGPADHDRAPQQPSGPRSEDTATAV